MPTLQAYYQAHAAQGFLLIGIEASDPASEVTAFVLAWVGEISRELLEKYMTPHVEEQ